MEDNDDILFYEKRVSIREQEIDNYNLLIDGLLTNINKNSYFLYKNILKREVDNNVVTNNYIKNEDLSSLSFDNIITLSHNLNNQIISKFENLRYLDLEDDIKITLEKLEALNKKYNTICKKINKINSLI